ncbi:non-specific lipid-transfer protein 2 [Nicotiana attenuata]|uniref:Non-specific lipid-transfer protein 2 n=1 Tax=Nicotiana attenuata TaxID=49451 RepID=A0A1J6JPY8_NICAT|nr:non-specific lipid-transfer protein 2 [Nicotiana attenuata]
MKKGNSFAAIILVLTLVLIIGELLVTEAKVKCDIKELSPCDPAFTSSQPPTSKCCDKLYEQRPCLCEYARDPNLRPYVKSPNAKNAAKRCRILTTLC